MNERKLDQLDMKVHLAVQKIRREAAMLQKHIDRWKLAPMPEGWQG